MLRVEIVIHSHTSWKRDIMAKQFFAQSVKVGKIRSVAE